jgi:hypothetical protein
MPNSISLFDWLFQDGDPLFPTQSVLGARICRSLMGEIPPSVDRELEIRKFSSLLKLRDGQVSASTILSSSLERRGVPAKLWQSIKPKDIDWEANAVPKYGLCAIEIRGTRNLSLDISVEDDLSLPAFSTPALGIPSAPIDSHRGRPTSMPLVEEELRRRAATKEITPSLAAEARYLSGWLRATHPEKPQAKAKTIENSIRPLYQEYAPRNSPRN